VPLADTAAALQSSHASALAELQDLLAKGHDVVDNHMTQIGTAIQDVAAVASIADNPLVAAAAGALHVPQPVLDGFIGGLNALAAAFPKPGEAPAQPEQPAEPQQEVAA
jgi:ABC-type transporter Mla subunit MlaD